MPSLALAVFYVIKKRSIELPDLTVRAVGEYRGPSFVRVRVEVAPALQWAELQPLLQRAAGVCYVSNTIRAVDDIEVVLTER